MFSASRIVAIDNEKAELEQLSVALQGLGIPCIPLVYPDQLPPDGTAWLRNVRLLFCDLHLLDGAAKPSLNYPVIGGILERMTSETGAPLVLILWTAFPQDRDALERYLLERHAAAMPVAVLALSKDDFVGPKATELPAAIRGKLDAIPQLRALYEWRDDVAAAADACIGMLLKLAKQRAGELKDTLDTLLSALAQAAYGEELAADCPGNALEEVLLPILQDSLSHLPDDTCRRERWNRAMPSAVDRKECLNEIVGGAGINTALHIVQFPPGSATGRERGSVIRIACPTLFRYRFSEDPAQTLKRFFVKDDAEHRWMAIQVEAACDFAQRKSPCIPFVLAAEIPAASKLKDKHSPAIWRSPSFLSEEGKEVCLVANVLYTATVTCDKAQRHSAVYRLRESLVSQLVFRKSQNEARLGIVEIK